MPSTYTVLNNQTAVFLKLPEIAVYLYSLNLNRYTALYLKRLRVDGTLGPLEYLKII